MNRLLNKFLTVVLMITYMAGAIGFTFSFHYCGGHYKGICFTSDTEKGCCKKNEHKTHCCKDKVFKAKFTGDHSSSAKAVIAKAFFLQATMPEPIAIAEQETREFADTYVANDSSPPFVRGVPLYLMNRVLRI